MPERRRGHVYGIRAGGVAARVSSERSESRPQRSGAEGAPSERSERGTGPNMTSERSERGEGRRRCSNFLNKFSKKVASDSDERSEERPDAKRRVGGAFLKIYFKNCTRARAQARARVTYPTHPAIPEGVAGPART